ncbi:MAG: hypothetical protein AB7O49_09140 [Sphingomonadales bacterium]
MRAVIGILLLLAAPEVAWAQGQVRMDPRLTTLLANAMAQSGVVVTLAGNDSPYAANISAVNGRNVCSREAERDVRKFQDAADRQPGIYQNFSYWQMSATQPDGRQKVVDGNVLRAQNPGKFTQCHNVAIEIYPR